MQITKEYIEQQIAEMKRQKDQHLANANAAGGALQAYEQQLEYLNLLEQTPHEGS